MAIKINKNNTPKYANVDCSNIPKISKEYNWDNAIGEKVPYSYMSKKGAIIIKDIINSKLLLECNGRQMLYSTNSLINGQIIKLVNDTGNQDRTVHVSQKYNVGDIIKCNNSLLKILSVSYQTLKNSNNKIPKYGKVFYQVMCFDCKCIYSKSQYNFKKIGCSCCANKLVVPGINDVVTTDPWMVDYFQGGLEEAKMYHSGSTKKIYPKCPSCNRVHDKQISIINLKKHGFQCVCSDGISYPEKFMINLLEQCNVNFIFQPTSTHLPFDAKRKRYDFFLLDYLTIIETHGRQHYNEDSPNFKTTKEKQKKNDYEKYILAKDYVFEYIVINCMRSDLDWIKNSICNSKLLNILNVSSEEIDWEECSRFAMSNISKTVCDYYNNHDVTIQDLCNIFHIGSKGIKTYLKQGAENGWCNYLPTKCFFSSKPFEIYKNDDFIGYGKSAKQIHRISREKFGLNLDYNGIRKCLIGETNSYKGYKFIYIQDYKLRREVLCKDDSKINCM